MQSCDRELTWTRQFWFLFAAPQGWCSAVRVSPRSPGQQWLSHTNFCRAPQLRCKPHLSDLVCLWTWHWINFYRTFKLIKSFCILITTMRGGCLFPILQEDRGVWHTGGRQRGMEPGAIKCSRKLERPQLKPHLHLLPAVWPWASISYSSHA